MTVSSRIEVIKCDITTVKADAIVNAANTTLLGGGGVDGAIHRAGGPSVLEACKKIISRQGGCKTGEAVVTTAGNLNATYIIHTVGPVWYGGGNGEKAKLSGCYKNCLRLAVENSCTSVAFPNISTGVYGFPKYKAAHIAADTVTAFLMKNNVIQKVFFVCYDDENFNLTLGALNDVLL
ncbi:MAG: O-acetyl-ADP-ribose deacetylase [Chitinophagaceae bacterium]|nr:O-acetyl-ADP-ribose deacetylase [Chitinophagaceae bacterium]